MRRAFSGFHLSISPDIQYISAMLDINGSYPFALSLGTEGDGRANRQTNSSYPFPLSSDKQGDERAKSSEIKEIKQEAPAEDAVAEEAPTEEATENMRVGFGSYITIYNGLSINPIYMIPLKEDENGEREGSFNVGLSYRF